MQLVLTLFHYFPYGGLERDMLAVARCAAAKGHEVLICAHAWHGEKPEGISVKILPVKAWTNHGRAKAFAEAFRQYRTTLGADLVLGFNRMPGLDFYFAADVCFAKKAVEERSWWYRASPRSRTYTAMEHAVFAPSSTTEILALTPAQVDSYRQYYRTPQARFHVLPPGIKRDRIMPVDFELQRSQLREHYGLAPDTFMLLMVGSDFKRKGLGRSIAALACLPEALRTRTCLWVAGLSDATPFLAQAKQLGVADKLKILGARDDVAQLMWSADLFLHPAYSEAAGAVLLEAMVAGLPVVATDVCGYAPFVARSGQGKVVPGNAAAGELAGAIAQVLAQAPEHWRTLARSFVANEDVFSMHQHIVSLLEQAHER
jgi:UDP-glucose:(heptosyl)LPS alpha-1,3-glucosyltransferase